jgi:Nuclease-related domain
MDLLRAPLYALLLLLPTGALLLSFLRQRRRTSLTPIAPFGELRRRPAGESLRLRIDQLNESIDYWIVSAIFAPIVFGALGALQTSPEPFGAAVFFLIAALFCAAVQARLYPLLRKRNNCRLGYQGERYVAEELNRVLANGFHIFNDVPFERSNMDHVLVGPTGVFVIETKTKRKPPAKKRERGWEVVFDGTALEFPHCRDSRALERVRRNRDQLSRWLTSATADRICAEGILTVPGWSVVNVGNSDIYVVNPKQIRRLILSCDRFRLSPAEVHRACYQLEQKCKLAAENAAF